MLQKRLSTTCEQCAAQIALAAKLTGEVREADIADLIYSFMRDLIHEIVDSAAARKEKLRDE